MDLRRAHFQFVSSDPAERRAELLKKFGVPPEAKHSIDSAADMNAGPVRRNMSATVGSSGSTPCSPRLQHRVPCFGNDGSVPMHVSHEQSSNSDTTDKECLKSETSAENLHKTPHVHVVPIKLIDSNHTVNPKSASKLPETNSTSGMRCNTTDFPIDNSHLAGKSGAKPKVCNIPVSVEDKPVSSGQFPSRSRTLPKQNNGAGCVKMQNGGSASKLPRESNIKQTSNIHPRYNIPLKQISDALSELEALRSHVDKFNGVAQDKQYRYLDEMLTRCMIKLDNVDTMGNETVRASRKAAIKKVVSCVNILESKVQEAVCNAAAATKQVDNSETMKKVPGSTECGDTSELEAKVNGDESEAALQDSENIGKEVQCSENMELGQNSNAVKDDGINVSDVVKK